MPGTAKQHFDEDMERARALCSHAQEVEEPLSSDLARSTVVFGVSALDAYLCDLFVDSLSRTMKVSKREKKALPAGYAKLAIPAGPLLSSYKSRPNWGLRMSARKMMEKDNLLQLGRIKELLNPVLPPGQRLWVDIAPQYIVVDRKRLTGVSLKEYKAQSHQKREKTRKRVAASVLKRIGKIVQRRHDIVHNCDRPKVAIQPLKVGTTKNCLVDIESFVKILDDHIDQHRLY